MKIFFVDGYNVINSWPELRLHKDDNLENCRQKLIDAMQNFASFKNYKIHIVFDAHLQKGSLEKKEKIGGNVVVVFTKEGETADSFIERKVNDIGRKKDVCVVTSDSLEQQLIFQRGATRMSSLEFHSEVRKNDEKISNRLGKLRINGRSTIDERLDRDTLEELEKIRRSN